MLSWVLLILVLLALTVLGTWFWGSVFGRGEILEPIDEPAAVVELNRRAVSENRMADISFDLVFRGYRPEQVDDVIAHLEWKLKQATMSPEKKV